MTATDGRLDRLVRRSLDRIASAAAALLDVPLVLISVLEGSSQLYVGAHGLPPPYAGEPSPLCREVAITGRPILLQDARRRRPQAVGGKWGFELVAYAGVALTQLAPPRAGALAALTPARREWRSHDLDVLRCLADATATVLDLQAGCADTIADAQRGAAHEVELAVATAMRRNLELEVTSVHDDLTGLLNRRGLFATAQAQLDTIYQHAVGGMLLYVDVDGLKVTNDRHGHSAGDDLLRSAADVLRASFRDTDTVARLGGDEFVVIATDVPRDEHPVILQRLAAELGRGNGRRDPRIPLAWSLGLVPIAPSSVVSLDNLMALADQRMYAAKRALHDAAPAPRAMILWSRLLGAEPA